MPKNQDDKAVDGRRLRSERSRLAIVEAALALQEEGVLAAKKQAIMRAVRLSFLFQIYLIKYE